MALLQEAIEEAKGTMLPHSEVAFHQGAEVLERGPPTTSWMRGPRFRNGWRKVATG